MAGGIIRLDDGWALDAGMHLDQPASMPPAGSAVVTAKKKKGTTTMDFIPNKRAENLLWWKNISANIETEGPKFGLTGPECTAIKAIADAQIALMEATNDGEAALAGLRTIENAGTPTNEAAIRAEVRNWKTRPGYAASGSEGVLKLKGSESTFDPSTFKSVLKVKITGNVIRIDFTKGGADAVAIYCRLRGTGTWTRIGIDTRAPYYDTNPLANPAVPEVREYMGRGMVGDVEIGLESDIVQITLS